MMTCDGSGHLAGGSSLADLVVLYGLVHPAVVRNNEPQVVKLSHELVTCVIVGGQRSRITYVEEPVAGQARLPGSRIAAGCCTEQLH